VDSGKGLNQRRSVSTSQKAWRWNVSKSYLTKGEERMFNCAFCKKPQPPGTRVTKVVIERREKQYPDVGTRGGKGWEIVKEVDACVACAVGFGPATTAPMNFLPGSEQTFGTPVIAEKLEVF
jgi:hypothetical protein